MWMWVVVVVCLAIAATSLRERKDLADLRAWVQVRENLQQFFEMDLHESGNVRPEVRKDLWLDCREDCKEIDERVARFFRFPNWEDCRLTNLLERVASERNIDLLEEV